MMVRRPLLLRAEGHAEVVSLLVSKEGVDVNQANNNGITPLIAASQASRVAVAKLLLLHGSIYMGPTMEPSGEK